MSVRRLAAIYDIHGNLPALEAVVEEIRAAGVDHVVVGGDVLPGPMARETLHSLMGLNIPAAFIMGNGTSAVRSIGWKNARHQCRQRRHAVRIHRCVLAFAGA
jgi:Icc-related predicted phosphoesterase